MADTQPTDKKRRIVRNPETFRERAVKAANEADKPKRTHRLRGAIAKPFRMIFGPIGHFLRRLFQVQPFKFIGKVFRFIGKIIVPPYVRNSWRELRQVSWPGWRLSRRLTYAVLTFAVVFGALIAGVDYGLDKLFKTVLLK